MDLSTISFSEFDTADVQKLLLAFINTDQKREFINGDLIIHPKLLDEDFIARNLSCEPGAAARLLAELISRGYVDGSSLTTTPNGGGLANDKNLPRISRSEADEIVGTLIAAARAANERLGANIFVESLDVFGSYVSDKPMLGDIDVVAIITDRELDAQPEDEGEWEEVMHMLRISDYVSVVTELEPVAWSAKKIRIYTRS